jgi:hypothetical protein
VTGAARALLLAGGTPPYVDPWHPFAATSDSLAEVAAGLGWHVERADAVAERLAAGLDDVDVLLVNAPAPETPLEPGLADAADAALGAFLDRPVGVLALHIGTTALLGLPRWRSVTGARWVPDVSGHPPLGPCTARGLDDPRVPGDLELVDERYTDLELTGDRTVLVDYEGEGGRTHPLVWAREVGDVRVVADTFGHDPRSFESATHRALLERCLRWVARGA